MNGINKQIAISEPEHLDCILLYLLNPVAVFLTNRGETRFDLAR